MSKQWYTYTALAEALGVKPNSAKTRAKRNNWPIRLNNEGMAEVEVNLSDLPPPQKKSPKKQSSGTPVIPAQPHVGDTHVSLLEGQITDLKEQLTAKDTQISRQQDTIDSLQTQLAGQHAAAAQEREKLVSALADATKPRGLLSRLFGSQS